MKPALSVIIPTFNEEDSIYELVNQIEKSIKSLVSEYEIIFIDDGSRDKTLSILKNLKKDNPRIGIISFRKNNGKPAALTVGFQKAKYDLIVTLDADLQDDPENIPAMIDYMNNHDLDLVSGWRKERKDSGLKVVSSRFFNGLVSLLFGIKVNDLNCGLKLYKKDLAKELRLYGGMHRFIPIISYELGYKIGEIPVAHHERKYGYSKYKSTKILTDIPDLFTMYFLAKYTKKPLHFFSKLGGLLFGLGFVILFYLVVIKLLGQAIGDRPLLIFGVLFLLAGIQTLFTGLLADLIVQGNQQKVNSYGVKYESDAKN